MNFLKHHFGHLYSSSAFKHAEINPAFPNKLLRLSNEELKFALRLGFTVDETVYRCSKVDGSLISPHFIIQTLTHRSYRDGLVPCNDKLVLIGKSFFEIQPISNYVEKMTSVNDLSLKSILPENQNELVQKAIIELELKAVARWDITKGGVARKALEETFYAAVGAVLLRKGALAARSFLHSFEHQ